MTASLPCARFRPPHFNFTLRQFLGSRNCPPRRDSLTPTLTCSSRSPALPQEPDGPCWDEHRPYKALLTLQLRKRLPSPDGQWVRFRAEGPSRDSPPALRPAPHRWESFLCLLPPASLFPLCPLPPPPTSSLFPNGKASSACASEVPETSQRRKSFQARPSSLERFSARSSQAACLPA